MCIHICIPGCVVSELGTCWVTWLCVLCRLEAPFHYSDPWTLSPGCALELLGLATSPTLELPSLLQVLTCTQGTGETNIQEHTVGPISKLVTAGTCRFVADQSISLVLGN